MTNSATWRKTLSAKISTIPYLFGKLVLLDGIWWTKNVTSKVSKRALLHNYHN